MELGFSVRQLAQATKLPTRLLQFWTDHEVLRPILATASGGRGVHRLYPNMEVEIANVLANVARLHLKIETIKTISDQLRPIFEIPYEFGFGSMEEAELFLRENPGTSDIRVLPRSFFSIGGTTTKEWRDGYTGAERPQIRDWIAIQRARRGKGHAHLFILVEGDSIKARVGWAETLVGLRPPDKIWNCYLVVDLGTARLTSKLQKVRRR